MIPPSMMVDESKAVSLRSRANASWSAELDFLDLFSKDITEKKRLTNKNIAKTCKDLDLHVRVQEDT